MTSKRVVVGLITAFGIGCGAYLMTHGHAVGGGWLIFGSLLLGYDNL